MATLHSDRVQQRPLPSWTSLFLAVLSVYLLPLPLAAQPVAATRPLTLVTREQATDLALQRNQSLRAQRLTIEQSRAQEVTAGLKPNPVFTSSNQDFPVFTPSQLTLSNAANAQTFTQSINYLVERGAK